MRVKEERTLEFPNVLRSLMKEKKITLPRLGIEIGVSRQTISLYLNGSVYPTYPVLIKIADFFDVSIDYLLTGISPIGEASKLLHLSEEAIKNIMELSPEDAQALSDSFSTVIDEDDFFNDGEDEYYLSPEYKAIARTSMNSVSKAFEALRIDIQNLTQTLAQNMAESKQGNSRIKKV